MMGRRLLLSIAFPALACVSCGRSEPRHQAHAAVQPAEASSFEFLGAVLSSLARAHGGVVMVRSASGQQSLVDLMTANQNGAVEVRMAGNELRPFSASQNKNRRAAVKYIISGYDMIGQSLAIQLAAYERMDSAQTTQDASMLAGLQKKASDAKFAYQQGSALLIEAATVAVLSTMVADHGDSSRTVLDMTDPERLALIARADSLFGDALNDEHESGPVVAAQAMMIGLKKQRSGR